MGFGHGTEAVFHGPARAGVGMDGSVDQPSEHFIL